MFNLLPRLKRQYYYLNKIELSRGRLLQNYQYLSGLENEFKIAPVLKSNAYGHGLIQIAKILDFQGAPFFCVDSLPEAYKLKKSGIKTPILIMDYVDPENFKIRNFPFSFAVDDIETLKILDRYQTGARIHVKVDTGMSREGVRLDQWAQFLEQLRQLKNIKVEGLMSHFASVKGEDDPLFKLQLKKYKIAKQLFLEAGFNATWYHLGATEAILQPQTRKTIKELTNLGRAGKAIYGFSINSSDNNLKPVLTLETKISLIKSLSAGDRVGYDGTFEAKNKTLMAILPIGYYDGVDRRLSERGVVLVDNIACPILGRVSMNMTSVDISKVKNPFVGQEVIVYSKSPKDPNSILNSAKICDTIPHEILVHLQDSIRRIIVD